MGNFSGVNIWVTLIVEHTQMSKTKLLPFRQRLELVLYPVCCSSDYLFIYFNIVSFIIIES